MILLSYISYQALEPFAIMIQITEKVDPIIDRI
jgi:hypothetical protein